jgi:intracellular sulfur oxidation DsrE/DsrF family protein
MAALLPFQAFAQQSKAAKYRLILQVSDNDPAKWKLALNNARNVQEDLGRDNVQIEIVAYGPGLGMLKADSAVADGLAGAMDNSVHLLACENTMTNTKVSKADMYGGIAYVKAGVTHIMKRQREGWSYIRP